MAFPTQDTVVSSTVTSIHSSSYTAENHLQCDTELCQKTSQDKPSSMQQKNQDCCSWLSDFNKAIHKLAGSTNYELFQRFLTIYAKNITKDELIWDTKLLKLAMLKKNIRNVLLYYHFYWYTCKEKVDDHYFYLQKMSDILVVYVNLILEICKSITMINIMPKVSNMLLNTLYIYLNNSEEHIFKVLLKSKLGTKENCKICLPIFNKCFSNILTNKPQITSTSCVRYILTLKLWKSISSNEEDIKKIYNIAIKIMGSTVPLLRSDIFNFLPEPPEKCINKTMWFLQTKSFDLPIAIKAFLKFEKSLHNLTTPDELGIIQKTKNCCHFQINENISLKNINKRTNLRKQYFMKKKKNLKDGEIIFIDLTDENDQRDDCKNLRMKKNVKWLKNVKIKKQNKRKYEEIKFFPKINTVNSIFDRLLDRVEFIDSSCIIDMHSNLDSCDNFTYKDALSNPINIFDNDFNEDRENENMEINKDCLITNDLFNDNTCETLIEPNFLSMGSPHLLPLDLSPSSTKTFGSSFLDSNINNFNSSSNDFFNSSLQIAKKDVEETCSSNINIDKTLFHKDLSLLDSSELNATEKFPDSILNEESSVIPVDDSSNSLSLDSEIDFSKIKLLDDKCDIIIKGKQHWRKKIVKTCNPSTKNEEQIDEQYNSSDNVISDDDQLLEDIKEQFRKKKLVASLKTEEMKAEMKISDLLVLDNESKSVSWLEQENKLEGQISDFSMTDFESSLMDDSMTLIDIRHWKKKIMETCKSKKRKKKLVKDEIFEISKLPERKKEKATSIKEKIKFA